MPKKKSEKRNIGLFVFGADWRAERTLMLCSEGARLLWFEILLLMAENEGLDKGFLLVNGKRPTPAQIATLTRTDPEKVGARLLELEENGVFSRDRRGVVFSRRIVRDENKARTARENGRQGGNPSLCPPKDIPPSDNQNGANQDKTNTLTPSKTPKANHEESESLPPRRVPPDGVRPRSGRAVLMHEIKSWLGGANPGGQLAGLYKDYGEGLTIEAYFVSLEDERRRDEAIASRYSWLKRKLVPRKKDDAVLSDDALRIQLHAITGEVPHVTKH